MDSGKTGCPGVVLTMSRRPRRSGSSFDGWRGGWAGLRAASAPHVCRLSAWRWRYRGLVLARSAGLDFGGLRPPPRISARQRGILRHMTAIQGAHSLTQELIVCHHLGDAGKAGLISPKRCFSHSLQLSPRVLMTGRGAAAELRTAVATKRSPNTLASCRFQERSSGRGA